MSRTMTRRELLKVSGAVVASGVLAACAPQPTVAPTTAAATAVPATAAPAAATKPAEATKPAAQPTAAPAAKGVIPTARASVPREKTLIIGFEGGAVQAPENANPYAPGTAINQGYHQLCIESLWYLNYESGEAVPWLAESYSFNKEFTEVTIKLRQGVTWADGEPFTADDVAYTLNMLRQNPGLAYGPEMQKNVKDAKAVDPLTVQISLINPYPRFVYNNFTVRIWGAVRILPKHIWESQDPKTFTDFDLAKGWPIWTGPYRIVKATANEFVYDRREDWWGATTGFHALPAPERVVFVEAGNDEKKAAALEANDIDGEPSIGIDTFLELKKRNPDAIGWLEQPPHSWIDPCPGMWGFNCELPPWDDKDMRWAVNLGIDRNKLIEATPGGFGIPSRYNFPQYTAMMSLLDENKDLLDKYNTIEFNPQKAMQLIESKGYKKGGDGIYAKDGTPIKVDLLVKSAALTGSAVPLYVVFMKNIGIDCVPQGLADTQYFDLRNRAQYVMETTHVACGSVTEPFGELNLLHSKWILPKGEIRSNNIWGYKNPEYDQIVDKVNFLLPEDPGIKPLFRQALEIRLRDLPITSLTQQLRIVPYTQKYWKNWPTEKNNYFHPPNWWQMFLMLVMNIKPAAG